MWVCIALLPSQRPATSLEIMHVFVNIGNITRTRTHKLMHRPWPSQKENLILRLLLYRGCQSTELESLRDGVIKTTC